MYDGELGVGITLAGIMQKRVAQIWGDRSMGNHGTANKSSQADSSRCLNELTKGAVKIAVGILFQNGTTHIQKDADYDPA